MNVILGAIAGFALFAMLQMIPEAHRWKGYLFLTLFGISLLVGLMLPPILRGEVDVNKWLSEGARMVGQIMPLLIIMLCIGLGAAVYRYHQDTKDNRKDQ